MALPQPGGVVEGDAFSQCEAQLFDGCEVPDPEGLFLQRSDGALSHAVALWLAHEGRQAGDPHEADLVLEILGHVVRTVVVAQCEPERRIGPDATEVFRHTSGVGSSPSLRLAPEAAWVPMNFPEQ